LSVFSCTVLFVSISQVIGCEDRLRNDLYCVEWGVKLYSNQLLQPSRKLNTDLFRMHFSWTGMNDNRTWWTGCVPAGSQCAVLNYLFAASCILMFSLTVRLWHLFCCEINLVNHYSVSLCLYDYCNTQKPIWILLKQETASGSGISCAICKSAPRSRQMWLLLFALNGLARNLEQFTLLMVSVR